MLSETNTHPELFEKQLCRACIFTHSNQSIRFGCMFPAFAYFGIIPISHLVFVRCHWKFIFCSFFLSFALLCFLICSVMTARWAASWPRSLTEPRRHGNANSLTEAAPSRQCKFADGAAPSRQCKFAIKNYVQRMIQNMFSVTNDQQIVFRAYQFAKGSLIVGGHIFWLCIGFCFLQVFFHRDFLPYFKMRVRTGTQPRFKFNCGVLVCWLNALGQMMSFPPFVIVESLSRFVAKKKKTLATYIVHSNNHWQKFKWWRDLSKFCIIKVKDKQVVITNVFTIFDEYINPPRDSITIVFVTQKKIFFLVYFLFCLIIASCSFSCVVIFNIYNNIQSNTHRNCFSVVCVCNGWRQEEQ